MGVLDYLELISLKYMFLKQFNFKKFDCKKLEKATENQVKN